MQEAESLDVINLKCDPAWIALLQEEYGFFPGYHMNKTHWITVALDGSVQEEKIKILLSKSYQKTKTLEKSRRKLMKTV